MSTSNITSFTPHPFFQLTTSSSSSSSSSSIPLSPSCGQKIDSLLNLDLHLAALRAANDPRVHNVRIPATFKLKTKQVFPFLMSNNPSFFDWWLELRALYRENPADFISNQRAVALSQQGQEAIRSAIKRKDKPWDSRLTQWFHSLPPGSFCMVRSSGAEDGNSANAGGNESKEYATIDTIDQAIGEVLASYFDLRSFTNQIQAGADPFEMLHLSLGIQELMGEPMGGESDPSLVPTSGVLFTNEPLYINDGRIMRLTTTKGHGNAVVKSLGIACDTFIILQSRVDPSRLYVVDSIEKKPDRLCPLNGALHTVPNPESLQEVSSVSAPMLKRLFDLGLLIEEKEGTPRDIEFVIKGEMIYIVQHRSVNRKPPKPAHYIDRKSTTASATSVKTVIPGHLQAQAITDFSKALVVDTLEEAQFIPGEYEFMMIKCDEPANSHPTVNLSERGIPVFYHPEGLDPHQEGEVTAFSPQQGLIYQGPHASITIAEGLVDHPAPIRFAFLSRLPWTPLQQNVIDQVYALMMELTAEKIAEAATSSFSLQEIKQAVGWVTFKERVSKTTAFSDAGQKLIDLVRSTAREMKRSRAEGTRVEFLFYAKAFRILLTEGKFSVLSLNEALEQIAAYEQTSSYRLSKELVVATLEPQIQGEWTSFLDAIDHTASPEQINALLALLDTLGNLRPLWITFYFCPTRALPPLDRLSALLTQIDSDSLHFLTRVKQQNLSAFLKQEYIDQFKDSRPLAKVMTLAYLAQAVDDYDKQLKALQKSPLPLGPRMDAFKEKLLPYLNLMHRIARGLVGEGKFHFPANGTLEQYLSKIEELTQLIYSKPDAEELLQTSGFSALIAQLGSGTLFDRQLPATLEDLFTLTHQNLLACIGMLYKEYLPPLEEVPLPALVKESMEQIQLLGNVSLIGIEQKENELILKYNIPQNNHSSTCQFHFTKEKAFLSVQMLGQARMRWRQSAILVHVFNACQLLTSENIWLRGDALNFTVPITRKEEAAQACELTKVIYRISLGTTNLVGYLSAYPGLTLNAESMFKQLSKISNNEILTAFHSTFHVFTNQEEIIRLAVMLSNNPKTPQQCLGLTLASYLVSKEQAYPEAMEMIAQLCHSPAVNVQCAATSLAVALVDQKQAFPQAMTMMNQFQSSLDPLVESEAIRLAAHLVNQGNAYSEAIAIIQQYQQRSPKQRMIELALALVERELGLLEIIQMLKQINQTPLGETKPYERVDLAIALVKKKIGYPEAIASLQQISRDDAKINEFAYLLLLEALIAEGQICPELFLALEALAESDNTFPDMFISVCESLAAIEEQRPHFAAFLLRLIQNSPKRQQTCLNLLKALVIKKEWLVEAVKIIQTVNEISFGNPETLSIDNLTLGSALDLSVELVNQEAGYPEAMQLLKTVSSHTLKANKPKYLILLQALLKKGQAHPEMLTCMEGLAGSLDHLDKFISVMEALTASEPLHSYIDGFLLRLARNSDSGALSYLSMAHVQLDQGKSIPSIYSSLDAAVERGEYTILADCLLALKKLAKRREPHQLILPMVKKILHAPIDSASRVGIDITIIYLLDTIAQLEEHFPPLGLECLSELMQRYVKDKSIHISLETLLLTLVKKGEAYSHAQALLFDIIGPDGSLGEGRLFAELVTALIEQKQEYVYSLGIQLAEQLLKSPRSIEKIRGLNLLSALVKQGCAYTLARSIGLEHSIHPRLKIQSKAFLLLQELANQGQADPEILQLLQSKPLEQLDLGSTSSDEFSGWLSI